MLSEKTRKKTESNRKSFLSSSLAKEITVILIIKVAVIFLIKWQFFSNPVDLTDVNSSVEAHMGILK